MTQVKNDLAANLKKYRKLSGMTINDAGALIGKSGKTVSAWENGRGQPDADMLIKLCEIYHVRSVADLLGREDTAEEQNKKPADDGELSDDERTILELLRQVPDEDLPAVHRAIKALLAGMKDNS